MTPGADVSEGPPLVMYAELTTVSFPFGVTTMMRAVVSAALFVLFLGGGVVVAQQETLPVPDGTTVGAPVLRLRAGPGIVYRVLGEMERGTVVNVIERRGEWVAVSIPEGIPVFVSDRYVGEKQHEQSRRCNSSQHPSSAPPLPVF